jgi:hypothetical protein
VTSTCLSLAMSAANTYNFKMKREEERRGKEREVRGEEEGRGNKGGD